MRILVTGGCGFVGHHFIEHLIKNTDWDIIALDKLTYASKGFDRLRDIECFNDKRILVLTADLSQKLSNGIVRELNGLDYIVHFAAETHVDRSLENSIPFVDANVAGTAHLLEWMKKTNPKARTIIFSTDEVFGPAADGEFFKEDDLRRPSNPYAASKAGAEMIAYSFAHAYSLPIIVVRSMNIIGERQHPEKFIPKVVKAVIEGKRITIHGHNRIDNASRCWIHARNVASGLTYLLEQFYRWEGHAYHIVGEEKTCWAMANFISNVITGNFLGDNRIEFVDFHTARPGHDRRYALDGKKIEKLGWMPPVDLEDSLTKTIQWMIKRKEWLY